MSRKHHCKHNRSSGGYQRRLRKRGLSRAPMMTPWTPETLARTRDRHLLDVKTGRVWS